MGSKWRTRECAHCGGEFITQHPRTRHCSKSCGNYNKPKPDHLALFMQKVDKTETCWLWTGSIGDRGYGNVVVQRRHWIAHRLAYTLLRGAIPDGQKVLHRCDNPRCVNPEHLFLGTQADNIADMDAKGRRGAARGVAQGRAKLTEERVRAIRSDGRTQTAIAVDYGLSVSTINSVIRRHTWSHVA